MSIFSKISKNGQKEEMTNEEPRKDGEVRSYNLIILDESGSMRDIRRQSLDGANETIQTIRTAQQENPGLNQYLTFVTFDSGNRRPDVRAIIRNKPIDQVRNLTENDYCPNGCTPLYDAVGISVTKLQELVKEGDNVLVTIITDGYENSSKQFTHSMVKELIDSLRTKGWVFNFIGANMDSTEVANDLGIRNAMDFSASEKGFAMMSQKLNSSNREYFRKVDRKRRGEDVDLEEDFFALKSIEERMTSNDLGDIFDNGGVLVFGSDLNGSHAGGVARVAVNSFGAVRGQAEGPQGMSYAIPVRGISLTEIHRYVGRFIMYAESHPEQDFYVTRIGCGHAGYSPMDIAPMFAGASALRNVHLPDDFWKIINYKYSR